MIYVVEKKTNKIVKRCDAWVKNGVENMRAEAYFMGYEILGEEITFMGNMVIWVA